VVVSEYKEFRAEKGAYAPTSTEGITLLKAFLMRYGRDTNRRGAEGSVYLK